MDFGITPDELYAFAKASRAVKFAADVCAVSNANFMTIERASHEVLMTILNRVAPLPAGDKGGFEYRLKMSRRYKAKEHLMNLKDDDISRIVKSVEGSPAAEQSADRRILPVMTVLETFMKATDYVDRYERMVEALLSIIDRSAWQDIEKAPMGKTILARHGDVFAVINIHPSQTVSSVQYRGWPIRSQMPTQFMHIPGA